MLGVPKNQWGWKSTPTLSTTPGTAITPGSSVEGSWTQIASGATVAQDVYLLRLWITTGNTSGAQRDILVDIGVDPAGGTSYTELIPNLLCSQAGSAQDCGFWFTLPIFIKAGTAIAARARSNSTSTVRVAPWMYGQPSNPSMVPVGTYAEALTAVGNAGTAVTPGNNAAWGSWTSLGTTVKNLWHWNIGCGFANTATTSLAYTVALAYGNGTTYQEIIERHPVYLPGTAERTSTINFGEVWEVPAGSTLYARASCSGTSSTGFSVIAIGIGG